MNLSAAILAGGESRRMGRSKAWLVVDGQTLIARAVDTVRSIGVEEVFISGRVGEDYSALNCPVLLDLESGLGPLGGIERGLSATNSPLLLVLAVDLPQMSAEFLKKLLARCNRLRGVVPELDGRLEPLAAIYPKRCHVLASGLIARSGKVVHEFAEACLEEHAVRPFRVARADAIRFSNWNHPADILADSASPVRCRINRAPDS